MPRAISILKHWLPLAAVTTALCGLVYVAVQQGLRQSANDPQIQMAEDAATALGAGETVESLLPTTKIDIAHSLAPFLIVFDDAGKPVASSGLLHDQLPTLPGGVLDYVSTHGEDRITWQPESGVRIAAVVTNYTGATPGFVLAGRSLREVEKREAQAQFEAGAAWLAALGVSLILVALGSYAKRSE